jgi:hypothetical protein
MGIVHGSLLAGSSPMRSPTAIVVVVIAAAAAVEVEVVTASNVVVLVAGTDVVGALVSSLRTAPTPT